MPLQNRVTPFGELRALTERGTLMGNRGVLHNAQKELVRPWQVQRWLVCVLEFKGRHRTAMKPGSYTELFFLDEATAFAAGHRPCFECRREAFRAYQTAWHEATGATPSAEQIDSRLEQDRKTAEGKKRTFRAKASALPDGCFIEHHGDAWLVFRGALHRWTPGGYDTPRPVPEAQVSVLTPHATVKVLRAGYTPTVHASLRDVG